MAYFGDIEEAVGTAVTLTAPRALAWQAFTTTEACDVTRLEVYLDGSGGGTGTEYMRGCIWQDTGSNAPGTLLTSVPGTQVGITNGAAAGWVQLPYVVSIGSGVVVWLGLVTGGTTAVARRWRNSSGTKSGCYKTITYSETGDCGITTFGAMTQEGYEYHGIRAYYGTPATSDRSFLLARGIGIA